MRKENMKMWNRILAMFLSLAMVVSLLPVSAFASAEIPDADENITSYTISVKDKNDAPVKDALVTYSLNLENASDDDAKTGALTTDEDGIVKITEIVDFKEELEKGNTVQISISVSKDEFNEAKKTVEISSTKEMNGTLDISMEEKQDPVLTVTTIGKGTGTVTLFVDGKKQEGNDVSVAAGTEVKITVEAEKATGTESFIKSITGQEVTDESRMTWTVTVKEDTEIKVEFGRLYTVSFEKGKNGTVTVKKVNSDETTTELSAGAMVQEATALEITVTPDKGYEIASTVINDLEQLTARTGETFTANVESVGENINVKADFVKVYTVEVNYTGNGSVTSTPACVAGSASTVEKNGTFTITATAAENYRVSKVVRKVGKGVETYSLENEGLDFNQKEYKDEIKDIQENCAYEITFSPVQYKVTTEVQKEENQKEHGTITGPELVDHASNAVFIVTAEDGYNISSISVNDEPVEIQSSSDTVANEAEVGTDLVTATQTAVNQIEITVSNVTKDITVNAAFSKITNEGFELGDAVQINSELAVRIIETEEEIAYIYPKNSEAILTTTQQAIWINKQSGWPLSESISINRDTLITLIGVASRNEWGFLDWSSVELEKSIRIIFDENPADVITLDTSVKANDNGYYNSDFDVTVKVDDKGTNSYCSGIRSVEYAIVMPKSGSENDVESAFENAEWIKLYQDSPENSSETEPVDSVERSFTVDTKTYNAENITIRVKTVDFAGNEKIGEDRTFKVNSTAPQVQISINNEDTNHNLETRNCFKKMAATVTFIDRADTFDRKAAEAAIKDGINVEPANKINVDIRWSENENASGSYKANLEFQYTGRYTWSISYTNLAGLTNDNENETKFDILSKGPTGTLADGTTRFSSLVEKITFGIWKKQEFTYTVEDAKDDLNNDVAEIKYYKADSGLNLEELETCYNDGKFREDPYTIGCEDSEGNKKSEKAVIYARIMDYADNVTYIGTDGTIYDSTASSITLTPEENRDFYNSDVKVDIKVADVTGEDFSSGIKTIEYWVTRKETEDSEEIVTKEPTILYDFAYTRSNGDEGSSNTNGGNLTITDWSTGEKEVQTIDGAVPSYDQLKKEWIGSITVNAEENNSSYVYVYVKVTDNAGNVSILSNEETTGNSEEVVVGKPLYLNIDVTAPEIIIAYDNNEDAATKSENFDNPESKDKDVLKTHGKGYFDAQRTATIYIKENEDHFDSVAATENIHITAADVTGKSTAIDWNSRISEWQAGILDKNGNWKSIAEENIVSGMDIAYKATITYDVDANYTFAYYEENGTDSENHLVAYTDLAGNSAKVKNITFAEGTTKENAYTFTIDTSAPSGKVTVGANKWTKLLETLTFGLYTNNEVEVKASAEDATSPAEIKYYKTSSWEILDENELNMLKASDWKSFEEFTADKEEQFVVYLKVIDYAGNTKYICSDGQIVDKTPCEVTLMPEEANKNGIYNHDVSVEIKVTDSDDKNAEKNGKYASGIKTIEYWVTRKAAENSEEIVTKEPTILYNFAYTRSNGDGEDSNTNGGTLTITDTDKETGKTTTETIEGTVPAFNQLKKEWSGSITVDAETNNSCYVYVHVKITDNAGNVTLLSNTETGNTETDNTETVVLKKDPLHLDIDVTRPTIDIIYDNNTDNQGNGYFKANRTATICITERAAHFDPETATTGIIITAVDADGKAVAIDRDAMISKWTTREGKTPDAAVHTATILYDVDANYTFTVSYTDKADNQDIDENGNQVINTHDSTAPYIFTVDKERPFGTITGKSEEGRKVIWEELEEELSFGFWSGKKITVNSTSDDETSPITKVEFYKTSNAKAMTWKQLDAVGTWSAFKTVTVDPNEQFVIYLKITDMAGNYNYISTGGMIVDDTAPREEVVAPVVTIKPEQPINGFYNQDVKVNIKVVDPTVGNTSSGLKTVTYRVLNMGKETQSGVLYVLEKENPRRDELKNVWTGSITVDSKKNNSNDVKIIIEAQDNALNSSKEKIGIKIDATAPKISIHYNNNNPDSGKYYSKDRVATITITERNFNADDVKAVITNTDGTIPQISGWKTVKGTGNGDNTKHTATITYHADGDYTFKIGYTDLANNRCKGETYVSGTTNPTEFTIDQTIPVISVGYSNNAVKNGKYFKAARTAQITIKEHNFDVSRVMIKQTAALEGKTISVPGVSWSHSGDTHTATIVYNKDGDYTFDISMLDMAGNKSDEAGYGNSQAGKAFTVDTKITEPKITGVEDGKAYKDDIKLAIEFADINFASDSIKLVRTCKDQINVDVTKEFIKNMKYTSKGASGINETFDKLAVNDGIYTLTVKLSDKAGNEATRKVTFTVNRFGSVYVLDENLVSLKDSYVQKVEKNLVITEYNANKLLEGSVKIEITRDGTPLTDVAVVSNPKVNNKVKRGESGWYQYEYTINPEYFTEDGVYKLRISSEDTAGNKSETSNYKNCDILFYVDSTQAEITNITGLEEAIINASEQEIVFSVFDSMGLKEVKAYVTVGDGKEKALDVIMKSNDLNNAECVVKLSESNKIQHIRLEVVDMAGNTTDTDALDAKTQEYVFQPTFTFNRDVTVSTDTIVRWQANKLLFNGTIAGAAGLAALLILLFIMKKRKNKAGEVQNG